MQTEETMMGNSSTQDNLSKVKAFSSTVGNVSKVVAVGVLSIFINRLRRLSTALQKSKISL